jgi:NAD(P)-dependent dehydrogenase (short-subunit alcohol dehydrogenase family)
MDYSLEGRSAIITGASQGLGLAIARAYVRAGASVLLCARDPIMLREAESEVAALASKGQIVASEAADVSSRDDVDHLSGIASSLFASIEILVNNAGIYGPKGPIEEIDWNEWARAVEINLYGSVLMCRAVIPYFKTRRYGKIVQLSGGGATNPLPRISAYAASKAAIIRFAETLAEEVRDFNIDVNSIAPGPLNTRLLKEILDAGPAKVGESFYRRALKQSQEGGAPLERGAQLAVFLGSSASDGITGKLLSSVWDPWESLIQHKTKLAASDVYTLRRIVAKDRGFDWEST